MTAPLCRNCGAPIAKKTTTVWFGEGPIACRRDPSTSFAAKPRTLEEAAKYSNHQIVSHRFSDVDRSVRVMHVWDGDSYQDDAFHSQSCAAAFGRAMAKQFPNWSMPPYHVAKVAQAESSTPEPHQETQ